MARLPHNSHEIFTILAIAQPPTRQRFNERLNIDIEASHFRRQTFTPASFSHFQPPRIEAL
jgi:hypothetical protein